MVCGILTSSPHQFVLKRYFRLGRRNLWEERSERLDEIEESDCVAVSIPSFESTWRCDRLISGVVTHVHSS